MAEDQAKQREIDIVLTLKEFVLVSVCVHVCLCVRRQKHKSQTIGQSLPNASREVSKKVFVLSKE